MEELRVAMVVTHEGASGRLRGRPMAAHPAPQENAICFLTDSRPTKDVEIIANNNVCLIFSDFRTQKYLSLAGVANLSDDRDKIAQLWSSTDRAFWKGKSDPSIRLLTVTPTAAEY
jgi:general stress protein 26